MKSLFFKVIDKLSTTEKRVNNEIFTPFMKDFKKRMNDVYIKDDFSVNIFCFDDV